ncbi:MAG: SGNH/GDSL hydrolase family protein [Ruminococcus sp.]|nr:SGNH/GDSL hydrolase family protein [Ruminococcus sp.]
MSKLFAAIVSVVSVIVFSAVTSISALAATEYRDVAVPVPPRLLILGDSIASGYGLEGYSSSKDKCRSYANILRDRYSAELPPDCPFEETNLAVDGRTSGQLLDALVSGELDSAIAESDCIVVSIGGNDLLEALWGLLKEKGIDDINDLSKKDIIKLVLAAGSLSDSLDENLKLFEINLRSIARYIRSKTDAPLIIQTLYDPLQEYSAVPKVSSLSAEKIAELDQLIKLHAGDASASYTVCDVAPEFAGRAGELTNISRMDIHPNAEGHKVIADALDRVIRSAKYSFRQAYEPEPAAVPDDGSVTSVQGTPAVMVTVICMLLSFAAGAAAVLVIKRSKKN